VRAETSRAAAIAELLTVGWDTRPDARLEVEKLYRQTSEDLPGDRTLVYAYALVKLQQRQYPEASRLLDQYLGIEKQDVFAWRAKAWISLLTKNAGGAVVELDKLSQLLADEKVKLSDEQRSELVTFLGRMVGFLEGPGEGSVTAASLTATRRKISERLPGTEREAFDSAISAVVDEFGVLATAKDDAQVQEISTQEKQNRERLVDLANDEAAMAERKEALQKTAEKIESEAVAEREIYAKADQPLIDQLSRLNSQAAIIDSQLANVSADILSIRALLAREKDPVLRDQYFRDLDRLSLLASRLDGDLLALSRRADGIKRQRSALALRHAQAQQTLANSLAAAQKEFKGIETKEKRADNEREKLKKPVVGNTGKVIALNKQAIALSTYESFPLEAEKQRILDLLDAK
jgi:hypothetical protein